MPGLQAWWQLSSSQGRQDSHLCQDPHLQAPQRQASNVSVRQELQSPVGSARSALLLLRMHSHTKMRIQRELHQGGIWPPGITQICTRLGLSAA